MKSVLQNDVIPFETRLFIERYIFSVEQLEILLLLAGQPQTEFTAQMVYEKILSARPSVEAWLNRLLDLRLVEMPSGWSGTYRFKCASAEHSAAVRQLSQAYRAMPVRIIEAIYNRRGS